MSDPSHKVSLEIVVTCFAGPDGTPGPMRVEFPEDRKQACVDLLEEAARAARGHAHPGARQVRARAIEGGRLTVKLYEGDDAPLALEGPTWDRAVCAALLLNAADAVRSHRSDRLLIVPGRDVDLEAA